jgi:peptidoglycan/LPS O-acetylase OafA/YrhL
MENNQTETRLLFLDNLRIVLITLVVIHHAGQAYGGGWWWFKEMGARIPLLGTFFSVNAAFFMSLFFMISGYFVPESLSRKGVKTFLKERLLRLGIPILFFFLIVIPVLNYFYYLNFRDYGSVSFSTYYVDVYFGAGGIPENWSGPTWPDLQFGHLWFLQHLLAYSACYAILWALWKGLRNRNQKVGKTPGHLTIAAFVVMLAIATLIVRIWYPRDRWIAFLGFIQTMVADVPRDLGFFLIGLAAYHNDWFRKFPTRRGIIWSVIGATAVILAFATNIPYRKISGVHEWFSQENPFWEMFLCFGIIIGLTILFREKFNSQNGFGRNLARSTYGVYLFHVPILISLQYLFGRTSLYPFVKFVFVSVTGVPLTFLLSYFLRKLPVARMFYSCLQL